MDGPPNALFPHPSSDPPSTDQGRHFAERDKTNPQPPLKAAAKGPEEGDTCRICRGEGTVAEPLFYPCKCSGSIKFVHQECLMEWLSHSQKKHCELCKTPFRFTKLYDSSMPNHLPTVVFLRKATLHMIQALLTWLRGFVVAGVWLLWLPWSMRFVWWGLFWIGDGGWTRDFEQLRSGLESETTLRPFTRSPPRNATVSAPGFLRKASIYNRLSSILFNTTSAVLYSPVAVAKRVSSLFSFTRGSVEAFTNTTSPAADNITAWAPPSDHDSLLTYVSFFHNLTPNPAINKFIIDILEGLIITLAVVTASILVFLIREWVVQQPALNFGGALADDGPQIDAGGGAAPDADGGEMDAEQLPQGGSARGGIQQRDTADAIAADRNQVIEESHEEETRIEEMSLVDVKRLVQQVHDNKTVLQAISNGNEAIPADEFKEAKGIMVRNYKMLDAISKVFKSALDNGDTTQAHVALEKLDILQETIIYFPWKDDVEHQGLIQLWKEFFDTAKQLLRRQEELKMLREMEKAQKESPVQRDAADPQQIITLDLGKKSSPQSRPSMPERVRSSLATNIQRDMQEATESTGSSISGFEDNIARNSSSVQNYGAWEHIDYLDPESIRVIPEVEPARHPKSLWKAKDGSDRFSNAFHSQRREIPENSSAAAQAKDRESELSLGDLATYSNSFPTAVEPSHMAEYGHLEPTLLARSVSSQGGSLPRNVSFPDSLHSQAPELSHAAEPNEAVERDAGILSNGSISTTTDLNEALDREAVDGNRETASQESFLADRSLLEQILDWIFDDPSLNRTAARETGDGNDEHVVRDLANEAPFVPFIDAQPQNRAANHDAEVPNQDAEDAAEAAGPGANANDGEAVEDAEDLEGVWELIGMQGPLTGVLQNAVFCAVFMAAVVTSAVWIPYLIGKLVLLFLANPAQMAVAIPLRAISGGTNFAIDLGLFAICTALFWLDFLLRSLLRPIAWLFPVLRIVTESKRFGSMLVHMVEAALSRISRAIIAIGGISQQSQTHPSPSSLVALRIVQIQIKSALAKTAEVSAITFNHAKDARSITISWQRTYQLFQLSRAFILRTANKSVLAATKLLSAIRSGDISLTIKHSSKPLVSEASIVVWTPMDRLTAVVAGYALFALVAALYLKRGSPFSTSQQGKKVERVITEILQQSGGVLKVILIISIEMILFPLYCGLLLDIAMLPLFQSTFQSRVDFTISAPWTSAFIHWFLGTCYMFHFALFVSMCRKIFRSGVLYFIRDPDDPTFHPVRDVLDRSVSSQLRKIGFSALVYGALVIICMGSVVWTIALGVADVFPVRWASNSPLLGFPIDLLLYNLFAPLALQFFRPSKGLQRLYESWFRFCASRLRLTAFLFGDDQEKDDTRELNSRSAKALDGRFVRAPASDQVRIPKGHQVFLEVDEENKRIDGLEDKDEGVHGKSNPHFITVWIPPWYRVRIALFAFFIWVLTAILGLSVTILPLLIGRIMLACIVPNAGKVNDVYAFSMGLFFIVAAAFLAFKIRQFLRHLRPTDLIGASAVLSASKATIAFAVQAFRIIYTYSSLLILMPTLIALLIEFYFIMPLHTYAAISKSWAAQDPPQSSPETHTVFFLQDCTLGLLYLRVFLRLLLWDPNSRPALALHAIVANGWLNPNIRIATRCFILPITTATMLALCLPSGFAYIASGLLPFGLAQAEINQTALAQTGLSRLLHTTKTLDADALRIYMIRFSYPSFLFVAAAVWVVFALARAAKNWRNRIRDEVYLIGERLHNFAERRPPSSSAPQSRRVAGG